MSLDEAQRIATDGMSFDIIRGSGKFPPRNVLNDFFQCGVDDAEPDEPLEIAGETDTLTWEPFELAAEDYLAFFGWCCAEYGPLEIQDFEADGFVKWFLRACEYCKSPGYINVDLDIECDESLEPLTRALAPDALELQPECNVDGHGCYEIDSEQIDPNMTITAFCDLLENLDGEARDLWNRATRKCFNIGLEGIVDRFQSSWTLPPATIQRIAQLAAGIEITLYEHDDEADDEDDSTGEAM